MPNTPRRSPGPPDGVAVARVHPFTARYVAEQLNADQDLIEEIAAMQMDPEDGVLSIIDSDDETAESVVVFTRFGIDVTFRNLSMS